MSRPGPSTDKEDRNVEMVVSPPTAIAPAVEGAMLVESDADKKEHTLNHSRVHVHRKKETPACVVRTTGRNGRADKDAGQGS